MVNRNNNANPPDNARASMLTDFKAAGWIQVANGTFLVEVGAARDHAAMRSNQLSSLLRLMSTEGSKGFLLQSEPEQHQLLWMAAELADEVRFVLPLALAEEAAQAAGGAQ